MKQVKGKANDMMGAAKGDTGQQIKGKVQKAVGKVQDAFGKADDKASRRTSGGSGSDPTWVKPD